MGHLLVEHLIEDGAAVLVSDVSDSAVRRVLEAFPQVEARSVAELPRADVDVYSPCALGASLSDALLPELRAQIVCGAANNQLEHPGIEKVLADRARPPLPRQQFGRPPAKPQPQQLD